jgi:hypothetical protein
VAATAYSISLSEESDPAARWFHFASSVGSAEDALAAALDHARAHGYGIEPMRCRVYSGEHHVHDADALIVECWR